MQTEEDEENKRPKDDEDIAKRKKEDEEIKNQMKVEDDMEMTDDKSLNIDRKQWIKAEFYNYSYSEEKKYEEHKINNSRIIYINKAWDNSQIYECILKMLENTKDNLEEIKNAWFSDIKEKTNNLDKKQGKKSDKKKDKKQKKKDEINFGEELDKAPNHPLFLEYLGIFNFNKTNITEKKNGWRNIIFPFDQEKYIIKKIIDNAISENKNDIEDIELLFKIIWKPEFAQEYKEANFPIEITKSEKLEDIFKNQREDQFLKKRNFIKRQ